MSQKAAPETDKVTSRFPFREREVSRLNLLINHWRLPLLFITGPHQTGKSAITKSILEHCCPDKWVWLDCGEFPNVKLIYNHILFKLFPADDVDDYLLMDYSNDALNSSIIESPDKKNQSPTDHNDRLLNETIANHEEHHLNNLCHNHLEFIEQLTNRLQMATEEQINKYTIVLDNAEYLTKFDTLIGVLTRLTELVDCKANFSIVMISTHSFEYFRQLPGLVIEPYQLYFQPYTQEALIKLIMDLKPEAFNKQLYEKFVDLTIKTLYPMSRDLQKVQYVCETQFEKHFVASGNQTDQNAKVWAAISHDFKQVLASLSFKTDNTLSLYDELPVCAKYILIAAYCASYNSPKTDKRFFLKYQVGSGRGVRKKAYTKQDLVPTGPKAFTLERLLHIYKALQELNDGHEFDQMQQKETTNHLLSQIMTFVSQKLLIKANSMSVSFPFSSLAKYRIADNVTNEFISGLASSVNFNLAEHLERNIIKQ